MSLDSLVDKYAGRLYCDELLDAIRATTDNNQFLFSENDDFTLVYEMLNNRICTDAFYVLHDTVYRNAGREGQEGTEIISALFLQRAEEIALALRLGSLKTLQAFAEIIPDFSKHLAQNYFHDRPIIRALWDDDYFRDYPAPLNVLERVDFVVMHAQNPEDILLASWRGDSKRTNTLEIVSELPIEETLPYLVKWIQNRPSLLDNAALDRHRRDLSRWFLETEGNLAQSLLNVTGEESTSLPRVVASVLGDQTGLLEYRAQRT